MKKYNYNKVMIVKKYLAYTAIVFVLACNNQSAVKNQVRQVASDTLAKSIRDDSLYDEPNPAGVKADDYYEDPINPVLPLISCWSAILEGNPAISFHKDSTFEFHDYNTQLKETEVLTGRFELKDTILVLIYDDRARQRFIFKRDLLSDGELHISNHSGYYFSRIECP